MVLKTILHGQMTEKIAFEVRPKKGQKLQKVFFIAFFDHLVPWGVQKNCTTGNLRAKLVIYVKKLASYPGKWLSNWQLKLM